eukprot:scaffold3608_cov183-Amphora_coffeaeformis.AAC.15
MCTEHNFGDTHRNCRGYRRRRSSRRTTTVRAGWEVSARNNHVRVVHMTREIPWLPLVIKKIKRQCSCEDYGIMVKVICTNLFVVPSTSSWKAQWSEKKAKKRWWLFGPASVREMQSCS